MKCLVLLFVVTVASAREVPNIKSTTAFAYYAKFGIPQAEKIRKFEEDLLKDPSRIAGGSPSKLGQYPYFAGLLSEIIGLNGNGVCGASLITANRLVTAAHCWWDGTNQAWRFTVVLGSITLFFGGTRQQTSQVSLHPQWNPSLIRNDVAVIYLHQSVALNAHIQPIALYTGNDNLAGHQAVAKGYGLTGDNTGITQNQFLSHVTLNIISNNVCRFAFPGIVQETNVCTSGAGGASTCRGDSGGPLVATISNVPYLVGVTSFGSASGCTIGFPAAFARISSFTDFINQHTS